MIEFTFNPEQVLLIAGPPLVVLGVMQLVYFFAGEMPSVRKVMGWMGLALIVIGVTSLGVGGDLKNERIFAEKIAELPIEWQEFHAELGELDGSLMREAVNRFALSYPPAITADQYSTLVSGSNGWGGREQAFDNSHVRACVILDFAEGKK